MPALPRLFLRPFGHKRCHQAAPLGNDFGKGFEQHRLVRRIQRAVDADCCLQHAGAGLGMQPLNRHVHRDAMGKQALVKFRMDGGAQYGISEIAGCERLQIPIILGPHAIGRFIKHEKFVFQR